MKDTMSNHSSRNSSEFGLEAEMVSNYKDDCL